MTTIRGKFKCHTVSVTPQPDGKVSVTLRFDANTAYASWVRYTPTGLLEVTTEDPVIIDELAVGQSYFMDLIPI